MTTPCDVFDIRDYGAVPDDGADDTEAVQAAVEAARDSGGTVFAPRGTYRIGRVDLRDLRDVTVRGPANFRLVGAGAGFRISGVCRDIAFTGIYGVGDGDVGSDQALVDWAPVPDVDGLTITRCRARRMVRGFRCKNVDRFRIAECLAEDLVGTRPGQGYGFVAGNNTHEVTFRGNLARRCHRHGVYVANTEKGEIHGNLVEDHRGAGAGGGTERVAFRVARSQIVSVQRNAIVGGRGGAFSLDRDNPTPAEDYSFVGNYVRGHHGPVLKIGALSGTGVGRTMRRVLVANNWFFLDAAGFDEGPVHNDVEIREVDGLIFTDNLFRGSGWSDGHIVVGLGVSNDVADYGRIVVEGNRGTLSSDHPLRWLQLDGRLVTNSVPIRLENNTFDGRLDRLYQYGSTGSPPTPTNANLRTDWMRERPVTLAPGRSEMSVAGYNVFEVEGSARGSTLTGLLNGYEGKTIELRFADAHTTVRSDDSIELSGGEDFSPVAGGTLRLTWEDGVWHEAGRTAD